MKLTVTLPDVERAMVDVLTELAAGLLPGATVGVGVPDGWTSSSPAHLSVAWDGTPVESYPVSARATIRVVAYAATTTEAKRVASIAQGLLCGYAGGHGISGIVPLIGLLPSRDTDTRAEIAWFTVAATIRYQS